MILRSQARWPAQHCLRNLRLKAARTTARTTTARAPYATTTTTTTASTPTKPSNHGTLAQDTARSSNSVPTLSSSAGSPINGNRERNELFRHAFRAQGDEIQEAVGRKLNSAYVPNRREYPDELATKLDAQRAEKVARQQVGLDMIWAQFGQEAPSFQDTFSRLQNMTSKKVAAGSKMAAMRIVLPDTWEMDVGNKDITFVDSVTGLGEKMRVSGNLKSRSAIVLRGSSTVLARAADELIAACPAVQIFQLGEVSAFDYQVKQLWPAIQGATDDGAALAESQRENIWMHKEAEPYWIKHRYEETAKPAEWTKESFEAYIATLVSGRLRPDLVQSLYRGQVSRGKFLDTDGIRVRMIQQAFEEVDTTACITPFTLKMALSFMVQRGGHRAAADKLFTQAEDWGIPLDTDAFNIILKGYVAKGDATYFHKFLGKMEQRLLSPNVATWLLFLELVQRQEERRRVIVTMYELGLFKDAATRRTVASIMASHDAYSAFKAGKSLETFTRDQVARYDHDWYTVGSLNAILVEFFRFHMFGGPRGGSSGSRDPSSSIHDFKALLRRQSEDGQSPDMRTFNTILDCCAMLHDKHMRIARWTLQHMHEVGCVPDATTYTHLVRLARNTRAHAVLSVVFLYGVLYRKLRTPSREIIHSLVFGTRESKPTFWHRNPPLLLSASMAAELRQSPIQRSSHAVSAIERAVWSQSKGSKPAWPLWRAIDEASRMLDRPRLLRQQSQSTIKAQQEGVDANAAVIAQIQASAEETKRLAAVRKHLKHYRAPDLDSNDPGDLISSLLIPLESKDPKAGRPKHVCLDSVFDVDTMMTRRPVGHANACGTQTWN